MYFDLLICFECFAFWVVCLILESFAVLIHILLPLICSVFACLFCDLLLDYRLDLLFCIDCVG